jgi:glycerophosphoryl diester phosphodiesterase
MSDLTREARFAPRQGVIIHPPVLFQPVTSFIRVGHKGADAIAPGNTLESFRAAVDAGVEVIEFDVLRPESDFADGSDWRTAPPGPAAGSGPLLVAHDWGDASRRTPLALADALDAFTRPPLDRVALDLDLKIAGREDEVVAALRERDLLGRAMTSTMEVRSIHVLGELDPSLRRGWTLPKVGRDWTRSRLARPLVAAGVATMRARLPALVRRHAPRLGVRAIWLYHPLASRAMAAAAHDAGCELICWTVDDARRIEALVALGADGICSNDPRLFRQGREA